MENIRIVALDHAVDDLRLNRQVGCLLVKNLEVRGFDVGVRCGGDLYGSTLGNVHLHGQRTAGLWNEGHLVALQGLRSVNAVPAVVNRGESGRFAETGLLVLTDADLSASFADMSKGGGQYKVKVRETRGGETRELPHSGLRRHWGMSGSLSLFRSTGGTTP